MLSISSERYAALDAHCEAAFYEDLVAELAASYPEIPSAERDELVEDCKRSCEKLQIESEMGVWCFFMLSFQQGRTLYKMSGYQAAHRRYIFLGYEADRLPIDLHTQMTHGETH